MGNQASSTSVSTNTTLPLRHSLHGLSTGDDVAKLLGSYGQGKRILITVSI